jgi:predicted transcriptional regulator
MTAGQRKRERRNRRIGALCRGGLSEREIADLVGLSPARVDAILDELGIPPAEKTERAKIRRSVDSSWN